MKTGRDAFTDSVQVDAVAQGRVWSGADAMEKKLIDEFGDLYDAIAYVSQEAGISDDHRVIKLPKIKNPIEQLMEDMTQSYHNKMIDEHPLGKEIKKIEEMKKMIPGSGTYMLMPYYLDIH